jgi:hypothetical protein
MKESEFCVPTTQPCFADQWLAVCIRILEVPDSNLDVLSRRDVPSSHWSLPEIAGMAVQP